MNEQTDGLDQVDEELLTSTLSDEALEASADKRVYATYTANTYNWPPPSCYNC
jgi:hypothetical protein